MSGPSATAKNQRIFAVLLPLLSLLIVWLLSHLLLYQRVDTWLRDQQHLRMAAEIYFADTIVIDIDDDSIQNLQPDFGVWPYDRDIYATVLDYLTAKGAKTVVFDILFLESRPGDEVFAEAVQRHGNAVFAISAPVYRSDRQFAQQDDERLLAQLSWAVPAAFPAATLEKVLLPIKDFVDYEGSLGNIGVVDGATDADGLVRRFPYVYRVGQHYIPSLPLVAHELCSSQSKIEYHADGQLIRVGEASWPVDDRGMLHIYFPQNANSLLSLSFYKVVRAARGDFSPQGDDELFRGKTVFIGSTAFKSDKVNTPRGMMSGTYLLALIHQNLKLDLVLKPPSPLWNGLWLVMALLTLLINVFCRGYCPWKYGVLISSSICLFIYGNGALFVLQGQPSVLLAPILTMITGYGLYVLFFGFLIKKQNVLLLEEKNELQLVNEALELEANTDTLTGMLNRRAYLALFEYEIERYKRTGVSFCVGIMDLDYFKKVNDTYGHDIGDDVLRNCAEVLKKTKRDLDVVARWGGEEFVIFFPETGIPGTTIALNKIRKAIAEMVTPTPQGDVQVTMSIGMAEFNDLAMSPERCIAKADKALYQAKDAGRNQVCVRGQ